MTIINTIHTNRWDQHKDAQRQRQTSSPGWADGSAAQWPDQRNPALMRQSCCSEFICCLMLSNSRSVFHTHLRTPLSLSSGPAPMTPSPLTHIRGLGLGLEFQPGLELPRLIAFLFWQFDASITRQRIPKRKLIFFLSGVQPKVWEARVALTMTARGGRIGEEGVGEVTDLSEDICGICWEGSLCNLRQVTEGRAEWFLPACVLTKVAESQFTESAPWGFFMQSGTPNNWFPWFPRLSTCRALPLCQSPPMECCTGAWLSNWKKPLKIVWYGLARTSDHRDSHCHNW